MLHQEFALHRHALMANTPGQKLFVALKLRPEGAAVAARPDLSVCFVVDTSGSMQEAAAASQTKLDLVCEALRQTVSSPLLVAGDRLALVKFDDDAKVLASFGTVAGGSLASAINELRRFGGGTRMGTGMDTAAKELDREEGSRRMILLTDGQTFDEELVDKVTERLATNHVPVTVIGVGEDWNVELLSTIADRTQGKPLHVVPDAQNPTPPSVRASDLPRSILDELRSAAREVVTDVGLTVTTAKDVVLERITRVYPTQTEVDIAAQPFALGNVQAGDWSTFILEFTLPPRPAARLRLGQIGLTYQVPGQGYRGETTPMDVIVEFTLDEATAAQIDQDVMRWVQQRNIEHLVKQATLRVGSDPDGARRDLENARAMTLRLGNRAMTVVLDKALGELASSKTITPGMEKTLRIGSKTQTLRMDQGLDSLPSDELISKITGA